VKFVSLPDIPDVIERITISYVVKDTEHWSASVGRDMSCNRLGWHDANQIELLPDGYKRVRRTCSLVLREAALELTVAVDALEGDGAKLGHVRAVQAGPSGRVRQSRR